MMRSATLLTGALVALACLGAPRAAAAQQLPAEVLDQRVRLELLPLARTVEGHADPQVIRGTVLEVTDDSVRVQIHEGAAPFMIAGSAIAHLDVSRGIRTSVESGLEGAGKGALLGGLEWGFFNGFRNDPFFSQSFAQAVISGAVFGAIVGGVLGALRPQERWERLR
jgi:hypothetical protein